MLHHLFFCLIAQAASATPPPDVEKHYGKSELILEWTDVAGTTPLEEMVTQKIPAPECHGDKYLYPTNPTQGTKHYHVNKIGKYDISKLLESDEECKFGNKNHSNPQKRNCFYAATPQYVVMSDYYMNRCGDYVVGVWQNFFTWKNKLDDHPYLLSKGRVAHMIDQGGYREAENADTYAVKISDFVEFYAITPAAMKKIEADRESALKDGGYEFDEKEMLFKIKKRD